MLELFLMGQTATGKHQLAIEVADKIGAEIVSVDSMKAYKDLDIGTSKPSKEEMSQVVHHLINIITPDNQFSVARFIEAVERIRNQTKKPLLFTGGTFLYYKALVYGFNKGIEPNLELRKRIEQEYSVDPEKIYARLSAIDNKTASSLNINDKKRIVRAIEFYEATGEPISSRKTHFSQTVQNVHAFVITQPISELEIKIKTRTERMIKNGLFDEAEHARKKYSLCREVRTSIGYKEALDFLDGKITHEDASNSINKRTRLYARKQMTWIRSLQELKTLEPDSASSAIILNNIQQKAG